MRSPRKPFLFDCLLNLPWLLFSCAIFLVSYFGRFLTCKALCADVCVLSPRVKADSAWRIPQTGGSACSAESAPALCCPSYSRRPDWNVQNPGRGKPRAAARSEPANGSTHFQSVGCRLEQASVGLPPEGFSEPIADCTGSNLPGSRSSLKAHGTALIP